MAKIKSKTKAKAAAPNNNHKNTKTTSTQPLTLSGLRQNSHLWYRILLLIYDFHHQKEDASRLRTDELIDPIYIGAPYFTPAETESIKSALVEETQNTLEATIHAAMEHRQATTLTAIFPCGPHDMVPVYLECFNVDKADITNEKFVVRAKRFGLQST